MLVCHIYLVQEQYTTITLVKNVNSQSTYLLYCKNIEETVQHKTPLNKLLGFLLQQMSIIKLQYSL